MLSYQLKGYNLAYFHDYLSAYILNWETYLFITVSGDFSVGKMLCFLAFKFAKIGGL